MYICVSMLKKAAVGEPLVLEKDFEFGEIAVKNVGGDIIGFAMHNQPEGCLDFFDAVKNIKGKRIITRVVLAAGDAAVLYSESTVLLPRALKTDMALGGGIYTSAI